MNHRVAAPESNVSTSAFIDIAADTIVVGADVTHPSGSMAFSPSIAAVVASDDGDFANFPGSMRLQAGTQEIIEELEDMLYERLMRFIEFRCFLPKRMLFYRDGVSEDQFKEVRDKELPQIRRAFQKARDEASNSKQYRSHDDELQLTFIVAGKRHHTRFFARQPDDTYDDNSRAGMVLESGATKQALNRFNQPLLDHEGQPRQIPVKKNGNLKPGLIVDEVITRPPCDDTFDFFLQSHAALQGTARSAHYSVLVKGDLSVDQIQSLTHGFCYNYARATKGVSYAGPAYYADRLCDRGSYYLKAYTMYRKQPDSQMTEDEKDLEKKERDRVYSKRIAEEISKTPAWNRGYSTGRRNPWHQNFDDRMFWL